MTFLIILSIVGYLVGIIATIDVVFSYMLTHPLRRVLLLLAFIPFINLLWIIVAVIFLQEIDVEENLRIKVVSIWKGEYDAWEALTKKGRRQ